MRHIPCALMVGVLLTLAGSAQAGMIEECAAQAHMYKKPFLPHLCPPGPPEPQILNGLIKEYEQKQREVYEEKAREAQKQRELEERVKEADETVKRIEQLQARPFEQQVAIFKSAQLRLSKMTPAEKEAWQATEEEQVAYFAVGERMRRDGRTLFRQLTSAPPKQHGLKESEAVVAGLYFQGQLDAYKDLAKRAQRMSQPQRNALVETQAAKDAIEAVAWMTSWESKYGSEERKREIAEANRAIFAILKDEEAKTDARIEEHQRRIDRLLEMMMLQPMAPIPPQLIVPIVPRLPSLNCTSTHIGNQTFTNCQ